MSSHRQRLPHDRSLVTTDGLNTSEASLGHHAVRRGRFSRRPRGARSDDCRPFLQASGSTPARRRPVINFVAKPRIWPVVPSLTELRAHRIVENVRDERRDVIPPARMTVPEAALPTASDVALKDAPGPRLIAMQEPQDVAARQANLEQCVDMVRHQAPRNQLTVGYLPRNG